MGDPPLKHPEAAWTLARRLRAFALVCLQLGLILLAVYRFEIEDQKNLFPMLCVAAAAFAVHAWLPPRWRAGFFVLASWAGILLILGGANGGKVIGFGLGLIAVCHLPLPLVFRVVGVVLVGAWFAAMRVETPAPFWPVLGSMFMFRLIVYVFETRHEEKRAPWSQVLAYFFPLPNVCFVLFPVLDFKTFRRTYYNRDEYAIYQTGVGWMVRGLMHLVAYRLIKFYVLPAPYQVHDLPHLALFLAANYALYVRVSGWFHLITGLLHLFGFNLPRTHDNYFLASSVSDIWRRINIYWKDFMTKVFFFPAVFALGRWGPRAAMFAATLWVFVATWFLHSYQMFWLAGDLPLSPEVAALWLGAGVLVALNLQLDLGRARQPDSADFALGHALSRSLRTLGTFTLVSLFWAGWTDPRFLVTLWERLRLPAGAANQLATGWGELAAILAGLVVAGVVAQWLYARWLRSGAPAAFDTLPRSAALHTAALALLVLASVPRVAGVFGADAREVAATLSQNAPTIAEATQGLRGYYEEIADARIQASPFLSQLKGHEATPDFGRYAEATRPTDDPLLGHELVPGWKGKLAYADASINRFGMRDRDDLTLAKPPHACRIALVGSSVVLGAGVADDEVFQRPLEEQLNALRVPGRPRFELLNFGVGRSMSINHVRRIETKVFAFDPDVLLFVAHQDELYSAGRYMAGLVYMKLPLPYPYMEEIVRKAGVNAETPSGALEGLFAPFGREITLGLYRVVVDECRRRGVVPVWVYLPMPGIKETPADADAVVKVAEEAGFRVLNLADWSQGHAPGAVKLAEGDHHPNALGHRLIAERLLEEFKRRPDLLPPDARLK